MKRPEQVQAEVDAMFARVDEMFDQVMAPANHLLAEYRASNLLRDNAERTRLGEPGHVS